MVEKMLILIILHILVFGNDVSSYDRRWSSDFGTMAEYDTGATYNVMDFGAAGDGFKDDTKAINDAWSAACGKGGSPAILFPTAKSFLLNPIKFDGQHCKFSAVHFQVKGQIVAPSKRGWANCARVWITFNNINGLTVDGNGLIYGHGEAYWHERVNQIEDLSHDDDDDDLSLLAYVFYDCKRAPAALGIENCNNVKLNYVNTKDTPGVHISVKRSNHVEILNVKITAPGDSPNTDGINIVASKRVTIRNSNIGTGDDCIAINSGSQFFNISNVACGPGHGISIGSLGKNGNKDTVEDIHVKDSSFTGTQNGARIKSYQGGKGYARRITFEGITLTNARNPIFVDQKYCPHNKCPGKGESSVDISDISFINFHGTSERQDAIVLDCAKGKGCTNIIVDDVNIWTTDSRKPARSVCNNAHGRATKTKPSVRCLDPKSPLVWSGRLQDSYV